VVGKCGGAGSGGGDARGGKDDAREMTWVCYLLQCADGTLYCGITNDLDRRLAAHNTGEGAKYTRSRLPVRLAYRETCADRSAALRRECDIKALPRAEKLRLCESSPAF
jgi:putative endonuclease